MRRNVHTFGSLIDDGTLSVTDGYRAKNVELGGDGLLFLRAGHVTDTHINFEGVDRFSKALAPKLEDKTSRPGDVAVTTKGNSTGRTTFVTEDMPTFVYSPHLSRWRSLDHDILCPGFLRYWSRGREFVEQLHGMMVSTDMAPYLSLRDQRLLRIMLPTIDEQRAIASVLGSLDDKIELNRRMNHTLEQMAAAIFKAWFVDFEPVRAKASGATSFPSMPQPAFDALPTTFVNSELGPIPDGWEVKPFSDCVTIWSGGTPKRSESSFWGGDIPWYSVKDAPSESDAWVIDTSEKITQEGLDGSAAKLLPIGTTIISARGTVGTLALTAIPMAMNQSCYGLEGVAGAGSYLTYWRTRQAVDLLRQRSHGSVFDTITRDTFDGVPIVTAPPAVLSAFDKVVEGSMHLMKQSGTESRILAETRDALLPKLLSGEVRVESIVIEEALA
ncbi:MAG: restriction endonuclease subunit S [Phycisphaerales bacterium]|nr:restriction endonuclease subunit S [Phycisphaerales bacterium]